MTATDSTPVSDDASLLSLSARAARQLATTTKTDPKMQGISPRWLSRMLPWVDTTAGSYRVNRRLTYVVGDGRVSFTTSAGKVRVIPAELGELPALRGFTDEEQLAVLASEFSQLEFAAGDVVVRAGEPVDQIFLIAHGKLNTVGTGKYGDDMVLDVLADGQFFGDRILGEPTEAPQRGWECTVRAVTACTMLVLPRSRWHRISAQLNGLGEHVRRARTEPPARNKHGEADIALASGHTGEERLPGTFVDYEVAPREYELAVAQTVLRVHTRVADLFNQPMNQVEQQLRTTVQALRERREYELLNNREFGLLHNADLKQRIHTRTGPPTPDDLDELVCRRRKSRLLLAHPRAIAAFGRECSKRGLYPTDTEVEGTRALAWRGIPLLPCDKIPVHRDGTTSILVMRTGVADEGVIGLHQTGIPDEVEPGLNVRFMGIDDKAIVSYLVSTYFSAAVLVPDALGVLDNVQTGQP